MSKQTLTIELDVPEGYEPTGEYRYPREGEPFLASTGGACVCHDNDQCSRRMNRVILRKTWQPPSWLPDGCWLFNACSNGWFVTNREPWNSFYGDNRYRGSTGVTVKVEDLATIHGDTFTPPPVNKIQIKWEA